MSLTIVDSALQVISRIAEVINFTKDKVNYMQDKSLSEITKLTRVEPLTIISKDLLNVEYMVDVNQSLLNMFAGYYLQAISILTKVNDVEVVRILDALNPDRDETGFLLSERMSPAHESIDGLMASAYTYRLPGTRRIATEADDGGSSSSSGNNLNEVANLSVGKLLNVDISYTKEGDEKPKSVKIPVNVRLMCSVIPNISITHLLTSKTEDTTITERYHLWRAGRLNFIKDLIFCQDLIQEHRRALIGDESGSLQEIIRRVNNSKKYGLLTRNPSLASASNLFVISETVAREIESKLGGRLSNVKIRQRAFDNTYAMIIAVVDREWERVTFYINGQSTSTDLSIKEIKSSKRQGGPEIAEMMKAMTMGLPAL